MKWTFFFLIFFFSCFVLCASKANKDTTVNRGVFVSLNFSGMGIDSNVINKRFSYFIFTSECGWWMHDKVVTGGQVVVSFLLNNYGYKKGYQPFETNLFVKYYPFKKPFRWIGFQAQCGVANSGMGVFDTKEKMFPNTAIGFNLNFRFGKHKQWAFTYAQLFYQLYNSSYNGELLRWKIGNVPITMRGYMGFNYTFPRK